MPTVSRRIAYMHKVLKSETAKRAIKQMLEQSAGEASAYELGKRFMGSDRRP